MAPGCFLDGFEVSCNRTFDPPRAFLARGSQQNDEGYYLSYEAAVTSTNYWSLPVELVDVTLSRGEARAYGAVVTDCTPTNESYHVYRRQLTMLDSSPFVLSSSRNVLTGVGWNVQAQLTKSLYSSGYMLSCASLLQFPETAASGSCSGMGCCEANVTAGLRYSSVTFAHKNNSFWSPNPCSYGMVVEKNWYNFSKDDIYGNQTLPRKFPRGVPFVLDFAVGNASCPAQGQPPLDSYACRSGNSSCVNATSSAGYICKCWDHYDGNPYIPGGCQDIDECDLRTKFPELRDVYPCSDDGICKNTPGDYECPCKPGMKGDGKAGTCTEKFPLVARVIVGTVGGLLVLATLVFVFLLRKEKQKMKEFFIRNGGPILENAKSIKIFKKEELKRMTRTYSHVLGNGAFGMVYKGFLDEQHPVAVKKSMKVDKTQKDQFANEVIIQSQVIHKNIVRLIGCCLEVDVPILVYEFVSNGSLQDILHGENKVPLTLDKRLAIATESAEGLAYMHSKTSTSIQHGDVKPANILLDDQFNPKISDFGISRLIARDVAEHTNDVIGDNNYMDPVYRETGLLTNKSDVYSFGLVLFEIITGKKVVYGGASSFVKSYLDTYLTEIRANKVLFDKETGEKDIEHLHCLIEISKECLDNNVDKRPEMTDIAERLQGIIRARRFLN
ncbi:wall-associated receptor kinase 1-like [Oryza brachyantha]|nr:wall-associated receptor kinase 1-like [Oryza brachyantha]